MQFHLDEMTCGGCARTVTKVIQAADPAASIATDVSTRLVQIESSIPQEKIAAVLRNAGFPPREE